MALTESVALMSSQYAYDGKGPFDAKMLVDYFNDLTNQDTWKNTNGDSLAFNGMIVAVWRESDSAKNGIYFLHNGARNNKGLTGDDESLSLSNANNWHKLAELSDISKFTDRLSGIESLIAGVESRLATLEKDKIVLRRDNDYNYKPIENTLIPAKNEICLVDVAGYGLRVKIGSGTSTFAALPYLDEHVLNKIDSLIAKGYIYQGSFYADAEHTHLLDNVVGRVYIDAVSSKLYTYNGVSYETQNSSLPNATAEIAGAVKLYDQMGQNTDGAMTQRAVTNELNEKFEMDVVEEDEMIVFDTDIN